MGQKFESSDFGRPGFFRRGEMSASLNFDGKVAWVNERFARCDMMMEKVSAQDFTCLVKLGCSQVVTIYLTLIGVV